MRTVFSPDHKVGFSLQLDAKGAILYSMERDAISYMTGHAGLQADMDDFSHALRFCMQEEDTHHEESYHIPAGKKAEYISSYTESAVHFRSAGGHEFIIRIRVFDDGAAFRYEIPEAGSRVRIDEETTDFVFDNSFDRIWLQDLVGSYENPYNRTTWGERHDGRDYGLPFLAAGHDGRSFVLVNEAAVLNRGGDYCVSHIRGTRERRLDLVFALEQKKPILCDLPFCSPWRYACLAQDLDTIVNSTLAYNLNPPTMLEDESWIRPSRTLWAWWADDNGAQSYTQAKEYVDFAAAYGFEAVLIDAGWDATWIRSFCDYAHKHSVQAWIWSDRQKLTDNEAAEYYLPLWKSWGVDGVKIDFFEDDSSEVAWLYGNLARICAREHLMVNFHGSTKPMGEGRTWPHFMTAEGIMGMEYYKWSDGPDAVHNCTVPFIRNAIGPMDYTPAGFSNKNRNTSMAHQAALAAVFQSGCMSYASSIYNLEPWVGTDFLRRVRPSYDYVRVLGGYPGEYAYILRWSDKPNEYVIGCICNEKRMARLSLDFLPDGKFEAEIYRDDRLGYEILKERKTVDRHTVLEIPMAEHGGAGIYIAENISEQRTEAESGFMCGKYEEIEASQAVCNTGSRILDCSDFNSRKVLQLRGGASFHCNGAPSAENVTIRLTYACEEESETEITDGYTTARMHLPISGYGAVFIVQDISFPLQGGPVRIMIRHIRGGIPKIRSIRIIRNHPALPMIIPAELAVTDKCALQQGEDNWQITGLEKGGTVRVDGIELPKNGKYILRIHYMASVSGRANIRVNGEEPVTFWLSGGVSFWSAMKEDVPITRELLLEFREGTNSFIITAEETLPNITGFEIVRDKT